MASSKVSSLHRSESSDTVNSMDTHSIVGDIAGSQKFSKQTIEELQNGASARVVAPLVYSRTRLLRLLPVPANGQG